MSRMFRKVQYLIKMTAQIAPKKTTVPTETKRDTVRLLKKWFLGVGSGEDST